MLLLLQVTASAQIRVGNLLVYENIPGLNTGKLSAICPTDNGYLWLGSENGLIRFDGYRYERITAASNSITDNHITDIEQTGGGELWIGGFRNGISRYHLKTKTFRRYPRLWQEETEEQRVNKILVLASGDVWLATNAMGLAHYIQGKDSFDFYKPQPSVTIVNEPAANEVVDMVTDKQQPHIIWLITSQQLYEFNTKTRVFTKAATGTASPAALHCIEYDKTGGLWLGTRRQGVYYYDIEKKIFTAIPVVIFGREIPGVIHLDVAEQSDSTLLWACGDFGLLSYNKIQKQFSFAGPALREDGSQKANYSFLRISKYASTGILVSMESSYLQIHPAYIRVNRTFSPSSAPVKKRMQVNAAVFDSSKNRYILAGTEEAPGLFMNNELNQLKALSLPPESSASEMADVITDKQQTNWMLGNDGLLYYVWPANNQLVLHNKVSWTGKARLLETDTYGNVWMLTTSKLYKWNNLNDALPVDSFELNPELSRTISLLTFEMEADAKGNVWISSNHGLWMMHVPSKTIRHIYSFSNTNFQLLYTTIKSMAADDKGRIWMDLEGAGLYFYESSSNSLHAVSHDSGYPQVAINKLAAIEDNYLLASTTEGLFCYNISTGQWQQFNKLDGLFQNNLSSGMLTAAGNTVFVNNYYHFSAFRFKQLFIPAQPLLMNITHLLANGKEEPFTKEDKLNLAIKLPYYKNNLQIDFAAMHWIYPMRTRYEYRLLSRYTESPWQILNVPSVQLSSLQNGNYTLQLRAVGADGLVSEITTVQLVILPPFWKKGWFLFLCGLTVTGLIILFFRFRVQQIRKTAEVRSSISRNLHDEIGSTLTSISILSTVSQKIIDENKEQTKEMLSQIAMQSKTIQQNMSDIVWAIRTDNDTVENLTARMREYSSQTLEQLNIRTRFNVNEAVLNRSLTMEQRKELLLIYRETINNIAKHSNASEVQIDINLHKAQLQMTIADNGSWKQKEHSSGTGTQSMKQRAESLGGKLQISGTDNGTNVALTIPIP